MSMLIKRAYIYIVHKHFHPIIYMYNITTY